ncbi:MAG: DUF4235 domain-containing protein [Actinomycetes bacterium]
MSQNEQDTATRVVATIAAVGAAFLVQRALSTGWRTVTGRPAPSANDEDVSMGMILAYAAISAGAVAVARVYAMRRAQSLMKKAV